jgi:hypothetical protein
MLVVLAILGVLVGLVALKGPDVLAWATNRSMATELGRVQSAIDAYNTQDVAVNQGTHIPARNTPSKITLTDADAPFAKYLRRGSRYLYSWEADGQNLNGYLAATEVTSVLNGYLPSAAAAIRQVIAMPTTNNRNFSYSASRWNRRIEWLMEQGTINGRDDPAYYGQNVMGYVNPVSWKAGVLDVFSIKGTFVAYAPPAVLITNNSQYNYANVEQAPDLAYVLGAVIIYRPNVAGNQTPAPVELFYVDEHGKRSALQVIQ